MINVLVNPYFCLLADTMAVLALCVLLLGCAAGRPLELEDVRTETPVGAVALFDATGHPIKRRDAPRCPVRKTGTSTFSRFPAVVPMARSGPGVLVGWSRPATGRASISSPGCPRALSWPAWPLPGRNTIPCCRTSTPTVKNKDIYEKKSVTGVFSDSLLDDTPLREKIESIVTEEFLDRVAAEHRAGRRLYVATTNLDSGEIVVWDMGFIAASDYSKRVDLYRRVLRASAAVPGLFKPVYIQPSQGSEAKQMHVDGGIKAPLLLRAFMLKQPAAEPACPCHRQRPDEARHRRQGGQARGPGHLAQVDRGAVARSAPPHALSGLCHDPPVEGELRPDLHSRKRQGVAERTGPSTRTS